MGSGTSRGKRVAPACVNGVNATKTATGFTLSKQNSFAFKSPKINSILRNVRDRAQPDSHSEGHDSDFSGDDEIERELGSALVDRDDQGVRAKKSTLKRTFRSKTYGLCHFSGEEEQGDNEEDFCGDTRLHAPETAKEPRVSRAVSKDVKERSNSAFKQLKYTTQVESRSPSQAFITREVLSEAVPTPEKQLTFGSCHSSSLNTPVILYDASEEELMDTIEREFS